MGRRFLTVDELKQREAEDAERKARKWAVCVNGEEVKHDASGLPMRFTTREDAMVHARYVQSFKWAQGADIIVISVKKDKE